MFLQYLAHTQIPIETIVCLGIYLSESEQSHETQIQLSDRHIWASLLICQQETCPW